jgi:Ner family transcriptional regulator
MAPLPLSASPTWDRHAIKAELHRRGITFNELSRRHGLYRSQAARVLREPWPRMERIVAEVLGVPAHELWPERYDADGHSLHGHRAKSHNGGKSSSSAPGGNVRSAGTR